MKLRSMLFVVVLLLLTAAVCAAQSPMGFSPSQFNEDFAEINSVIEGPECTYDAGDEEDGAYIDYSDSIYIHLLYSGDEVTEMNLYFNIANDDDEGANAVGMLLYSTFLTLANESGVSLDTIDFDELAELINDLLINETATDYCGYHFEMETEEDEESGSGSLWVTKGEDEASTSSGSQAAGTEGEKAFDSLIDEFIADNIVPAGGSYYHKDDYTDEWAQIDWYQWTRFDSLQNFVFSAAVSWTSAHDRPNTFNAGCGIVFREKDTNNMLEASLRMDGYVYLDGARYGNYLSYSKVGYGPSQIKATHQFVVVANGDSVAVYVDGVRATRWNNVAITDEGYIGLATMSGTNKDFGTRCEW